jgi:hypothetical protein
MVDGKYPYTDRTWAMHGGDGELVPVLHRLTDEQKSTRLTDSDPVWILFGWLYLHGYTLERYAGGSGDENWCISETILNDRSIWLSVPYSSRPHDAVLSIGHNSYRNHIAHEVETVGEAAAIIRDELNLWYEGGSDSND